jgi:hypothetical protein
VSGLHLGVILPNYGALLDAEGFASAAVAAEEAGVEVAEGDAVGR